MMTMKSAVLAMLLCLCVLAPCASAQYFPAAGGVPCSSTVTTNCVVKANGAGAVTIGTTVLNPNTGIASPAFAGSGSDPSINLPSNTTHSYSSGDVVNNAGTLQFNNGTATVPLMQGIFTSASQIKAPTVTVLTSGTAATYTTPTGALYLVVECVGGGGGGVGSGTSPGPASAGGTTTFGGLTCGGGGGGSSSLSVGGTATGGDINIPGGSGGQIFGFTFTGGVAGAASFFGGSGGGGNANGSIGGNAATNSGSGGGAAGNPNVNSSGGGGSAGGYVKKTIASPSATYTYTVGALGAGGTLGSTGYAGGNGGAGIIVVTACFQ